jgi:mannosyltransferase OCH1-like enzyme
MELIQYWHSPRPPEDVGRLIDSFRTASPGLRHRLYDRRSAGRFIAARCGEREARAFAACAVPAMQADYFRYCALSVAAGVYADADMACHGDLAPLLATAAPVQLFFRPNGVVPNGFLIAGVAAHPFFRLTLRIATLAVERRISESVWVATGPAITTFLYELSTERSLARLLAAYAAEDDPGGRRQRALCEEVIGEVPDLDQVFSGVEFTPFAALAPYVASRRGLGYQSGPLHWVSWTGSIYR